MKVLWCDDDLIDYDCTNGYELADIERSLSRKGDVVIIRNAHLLTTAAAARLRDRIGERVFVLMGDRSKIFPPLLEMEGVDRRIEVSEI